ncbi:MAG: zinc dependent phospholipase C family protein [Christensenellales bacterium]
MNMPSWVTHLMIADMIMEKHHGLDRRGFCVGSIAPDCNIENDDWTCFIPPREVTHWMSKERKTASDCDAFYQEYIVKRNDEIQSHEQYSFLLGYYVHLMTDAAFEGYLHDENRIKDTWERIYADKNLFARANGYIKDWNSVKELIPKKERIREIHSLEAAYLRDHPTSGYLTEILPLKEFPDYIDYLPYGSIARKIAVMGYLPELNEKGYHPISISREEFAFFIDNTVMFAVDRLREKIRRSYENSTSS